MKIIGHRGARGLSPENTIASLRKALEHRVDEIEFDVRVTKDNLVILHHDPELVDAAGNELRVRDHTFAELKKHKPDLATFDEAIEAISRRVPMLIEVKPGEPTQPIVAIIKKYLGKGWRPDDIILCSFSQAILLELHAALPDIQKVVNEQWSGVRASHRARQLQTKRICMAERWLWWGFIRSVQRGGYNLTTYTLNDPAKAKRWEKFGLYAVITDFPDRFEK